MTGVVTIGGGDGAFTAGISFSIDYRVSGPWDGLNASANVRHGFRPCKYFNTLTLKKWGVTGGCYITPRIFYLLKNKIYFLYRKVEKTLKVILPPRILQILTFQIWGTIENSGDR